MSSGESNLKYCCGRWGFTHKNLPDNSPIPYAVFRSGGVFNGFALSFVLDEKRMARDGYFEMGAIELRAAMEMAFFHNESLVIIVKWSDSLSWWRWKPGDSYMGFGVSWGKFNKKQTLVVKLPHDKFTEVRKIDG